MELADKKTTPMTVAQMKMKRIAKSVNITVILDIGVYEVAALKRIAMVAKRLP